MDDSARRARLEDDAWIVFERLLRPPLHRWCQFLRNLRDLEAAKRNTNAIVECNLRLLQLSKKNGFAFIARYTLDFLAPHRVGTCAACDCEANLIAHGIDIDGGDALYCAECVDVNTQIEQMADPYGSPIDLCPECHTVNLAGQGGGGTGYKCNECGYKNGMWIGG